ncbi:MAG: dockerin type I repeat-containing protein [Candidatus Zixiibacteriota bacterium]
MNTASESIDAEKSVEGADLSDSNFAVSLGFDDLRTLSPGITVGTTTYLRQSNARMNRQVEWRSNQNVHFVWTKSTNYNPASLDRGTAYETWDADAGSFVFDGEGGGCNIHPRLGPGVNYSGYVSLDVDTEGKAVIANHHDEGAGFATTVWYDFDQMNCFFSPYRSRMPDSLMMSCNSPEDITQGYWRMMWPNHEYQVWDGDTVTHVFAHQMKKDDHTSSVICYFRRIGSDTLGSWDYPCMLIDTVSTVSQIVTASRVSGKVALVWQAPPGMYPGDPESMTRDWLDPGLGVNQRINDVYYMISSDMGATWGMKQNLTQFDSTQGGWLGQGEMSALIDTNDRLHILWSARQVVPGAAGLGHFVNFWGSQLLHWEESIGHISTVADANWDIEDELADTFCVGGEWNEMSIVKCMLSECDNKFYAFFVQFQDVYKGIYDDCHNYRFTRDMWYGTANGEIYVSISNDGGYCWDYPTNLTNSYTPNCDPSVGNDCAADNYLSVSRFGMDITGADFTGVPIIDPSELPSSIPILPVIIAVYVVAPSPIVSLGIGIAAGIITYFVLKACDPKPGPVLSTTLTKIGKPNWTKPNEPLVINDIWKNTGNMDANIFTIVVDQPEHVLVEGWSSIVHPEATTNVTITIKSDRSEVIKDNIRIYSNSLGRDPIIIPIEIPIAESFQEAKSISIRTRQLPLEITGATAGRVIPIGGLYQGPQHTYEKALAGGGGYNLNFFDDCDTTNNMAFEDDNSAAYLYQASPFVSYIKNGDTILNYSMYNTDWLSADGFTPIEEPYADSTSYPDYQYGYSGQFVSKDSSIGIELEYYAPLALDASKFIVMRQKFFNNSGTSISGVYLGEILDWDIPSDSGTRNGSDFDYFRKLMYCYGGEYGPDSIENNDCILADQRAGGNAYVVGYKTPYYSSADSIGDPRAMWTENNGTYVYPRNAFVPEQMYRLFVDKYGYSYWESSWPDSFYTDLHTVCVYGQWNIQPGDTLIFCKILASELNGGITGLSATIDKARAWIAQHPEICSKPQQVACDCNSGDANGNGSTNILDITFLINYLYKGGPAPIPYPICSGDANCNCFVNILDVTYLITYLYRGGPAPCQCSQWLNSCGGPPRK